MPFPCTFITEKIKDDLIYNADRDSDQERIEYLRRNY